MTRPHRDDHAGDWHHVMNRGGARRPIFTDDHDRRTFLALLADLDPRFHLEVHAYCLMGNHFHLLVRSADGRLSAAMQHLLAVFTRRTNHRVGADGALFRGRFHSVRVDRDEHLLELVRYVHRNPTDLGWHRPLVEYPWSSHAAHAGVRTPPRWLRTDAVAELFAGDPSAYRRFVERDETTPPPHPSGPLPTARPGGPASPPPPGVGDVVAAVAAASGVAGASVRLASTGVRNDARLVALLLASTITSSPADALAAEFGFRGAGGVRSGLTRARRALQTSPEARRIASEAARALGCSLEALPLVS